MLSPRMRNRVIEVSTQVAGSRCPSNDQYDSIGPRVSKLGYFIITARLKPVYPPI